MPRCGIRVGTIPVDNYWVHDFESFWPGDAPCNTFAQLTSQTRHRQYDLRMLEMLLFVGSARRRRSNRSRRRGQGVPTREPAL